LLKRYTEVPKTPEVLVRELKEPPLSNLISHYYVKPVNYEKDPYFYPYQNFNKGGATGQF
jgi:hypothetical protein